MIQTKSLLLKMVKNDIVINMNVHWLWRLSISYTCIKATVVLDFCGLNSVRGGGLHYGNNCKKCHLNVYSCNNVFM